MRQYLIGLSGSNSQAVLAITRIVVYGDFELLRGGMRLVDLPGTNDINRFRGDLSKRYIRTCPYVWLLLDSDKCASLDINGHLFQQLVREKRLSECAIVITKVDNMTDSDDQPIERIWSHER